MRTADSKLGTPKDVAGRLREGSAGGGGVALTSGRFDLLSAAHVRFLNAARAQADVLVVVVVGDEAVPSGPAPVMPVGDRGLLVAALRSVDHVILAAPEEVSAAVLELRPDVYCPTSADAGGPLAQAVLGYGGRIAAPGDLDEETRRLMERVRR